MKSFADIVGPASSNVRLNQPSVQNAGSFLSQSGSMTKSKSPSPG